MSAPTIGAAMPADIKAKLEQAMAHHRLGQLLPAEAAYRDVLVQAPLHFDALHLLGVLRHQQGDHEAAVALIRSAIAIKPYATAAHSNLGLALRQLGRLDEALASLEQALSLKPNDAPALNNRGNILRDLKRHADALASYERVLSLQPAHGAALKNRGAALLDLQRYAEALASFELALAIASDDIEALQNRGNALMALRRPTAAIASYDQVLAREPNHVEALRCRGDALLDLNRHSDALASFERALALRPDDVGALNNRGIALAGLDRHQDALASYDRALTVAPAYAEALANRGCVLSDLGRFEEATLSLASALEYDPNYPFAKGQLLFAQMKSCDWTEYCLLADALRDDVRAGKRAAEPFGYQAVTDDPADLRRCAELFAAARFPSSPAPLWKGERYVNARIRIGYLSGEFRHQATSILMTELFERHDRSRFELFAFDNGWNDGSEIRRRIEGAFDEIVDVTRLDDLSAAMIIRQKEIDILINLNGYFGRGRLGVFAHRPCPVQVNYLGFPGTIGASYIDYIVADSCVIPPEHDAFYSEKVVRLPDTYQVNDSKRRIAEQTPTRADVGLPQAGFVFCCFNNNYKITPDVFDVWMHLLANVDGSVLWLYEATAAAVRNLRREAQRRGIAPERLVFARAMDLDKHLARHRLADLFVDTLPYNAHTTASDALWAGLPVLTCMGRAFPGRVASSLLIAIGLSDMVTDNLADYEALALKLATTPALLAHLRERLATNRDLCPLFDSERFRHHLESAYVTMWARAQQGERPEAFTVRPLP